MTAMSYITHAREDGCIKTKSEWADELTFAEGDQSATCNACQRSVWKAGRPENPKRQKLSHPAVAVPANPVRSTRASRQADHRTKMASRDVYRAERPARVGIPASINRRTGKPHEHARVIARRLRQRGGAA